MQPIVREKQKNKCRSLCLWDMQEIHLLVETDQFNRNCKRCDAATVAVVVESF